MWLERRSGQLLALAAAIDADFIPAAKVISPDPKSPKPANRLDRARCRLLARYWNHTEKNHDRRVAALIEAVTGESWSKEAQRKWRERHFEGRPSNHVC
jgi:hypothetical protein